MIDVFLYSDAAIYLIVKISVLILVLMLWFALSSSPAT